MIVTSPSASSIQATYQHNDILSRNNDFMKVLKEQMNRSFSEEDEEDKKYDNYIPTGFVVTTGTPEEGVGDVAPVSVFTLVSSK